MKILLINHYAGSPKMGMEYRPYYLAKEWVKLGHEVTILTASFSHLRGKNPDIEFDDNCSFEEKVIDNIRYVFVKTSPYSENDLKRSINVFDFVRTLHTKAKFISEKYSPNIVIASSTYPFDFRVAKKIAGFSSAKVIFEVHDLWPLSLISLYKFSKYNPIIKYMEIDEHFAMENADAVVSILPDVNKYILERGLVSNNYHYIPNGIDIKTSSTNQKATQHIEFLNRYRNKNMFIVMYIGGFAQANALDEFVDAAKLVDDNTIFVLVGNGTHKIKLKRYARLNQIENIFFLDRVVKEQVNDILQLADVLYIGAKNMDLYNYGIGMNKLFEYLFSGKPIIYGIKSSNNPVQDADCGISIEAENSKAIADAVKEFKNMSKEKRISMGKRGHIYAIKNHSYEILAQKFLDIMEAL